MKLRLAFLVSATAFAMCLGSGRAAEHTGHGRQLADADKAFLNNIAAVDKSEIEMGIVAADKAVAPAVRSLALQMLDQHSDNLRNLQALSHKKGYLIAPRLDAGHRELLHMLQAADSNEGFDSAYLGAVVADHAHMASAIERVANNSSDGDIAVFAADTLAALRKHEQIASDLAAR
jgi:putative membrane protein